MLEEVFEGEIALITGAARGLGRTIAQMFAQVGATVVVHYNQSEQEAQSLVEQISTDTCPARAYAADMTDEYEVAAMIEQIVREYKRLDILVNNVGPFADIPLRDLPEGDWEWIVNGNVKSAYLGCRYAGKAMIAGGEGCIVNIAATAGLDPSQSVYGIAKNAVIQLTKAMALELAPQVRVNAVAPGIIPRTELSREVLTQWVQETPLGKLASAEEIARMVLLLCTDFFAHVTGETILMDGGRSLHR